jgi:nicotinamide phosphoribosyltransferase
MNNLLLTTDSYKYSHFEQYPPGTEYISSYIEARGGKWNELVFFGLQIFLEQLAKGFSQDDISEAAEVCEAHGVPFNRAGFESMFKKYGGKLPITIQAVSEGTVMPLKNVLVQITNTDPEFYWLPSFLETSLLRAVWYPTTVCTNSYQCKKIIWNSLQQSCDNPSEQIAFRMHDFAARGVSSAESAGIGGCSHLVNFLGTDTVEGLMYARKYYGEKMAGYSIPASEHSSMTSWGGPSGEVKAMKNMLDKFAKPGTILACVSDSYDIWNAIRNYWGGILKNQLIESGATLVVRPDSGDPNTVPTKVVEELWNIFGGTVNAKGYKVLHPCVRVIQGDGIQYETIKTIYENLTNAGFSAENLAVGQGGALLQKIDRDTLQFAMKASSITVDGNSYDVFKQPVEQPNKISKKGRLALVKNQGQFETIREDQLEHKTNLLETVFHNGEILRFQSFASVRAMASKEF